MLDLLLKNCRIVDGMGNPWFKGDIGITGDRIARMGDLSGAAAHRVVDAAGRAAAPGFIDIHSHSDFTLHEFPRSESRIFQGVTTEVVGNCGFSPFPVAPDHREELEKYTGFLTRTLPWSWADADGFARFLGAFPLGPNVVLQVGHGTVRIAVMGFDNRPATPDELAAMDRLVAQAMAQGAAGLSSGLAYAPGCYAPESELVALARVVARYGGFYSSHIRNESDRVEESVAEALTVGREAALPVQLSHHKAAGRSNWGKVHRTLALMDEARSRGEDVAADQYPYTASATTMTSQLPDWALAGGVDAMMARLRDPATREQIRQHLRRGDQDRWEQVHVSSVAVPDHRTWEGRCVAEVARAWGIEPAEAVCQLLEANAGDVGQVSFTMDEADVRTVMRHPAVAIGSDGLAFAPRGGGKPHPRYYGTFARVLGHYRRDEGILSLEEAVRKMTSLPAARVRLWDRGILRPGAAADVVLFDPETVADAATFSDPHRYPIGIDLVIVGGQILVEGGQDTGATAGRLLRRGEGAGLR